MLATFTIAATKYLTRSSFIRKRFILATAEGQGSLWLGKTPWPEWLSAVATNEAACSHLNRSGSRGQGVFAHWTFISSFVFSAELLPRG